MFTMRYWKENAAALKDAPKQDYGFGGADGVKHVAALKGPKITLGLPGGTVGLTGNPVLTEPIGNMIVDAFYGNLGQDLLRPFASYTIDFRAMRFSVQR